MDKLIDLIVDRIARYWAYAASGIALSLLVPFLLFLSLRPDTAADGNVIPWLVVGASCPIVLLVWLASNRVPRTKKGRVGFVLAIACETDEQQQRVRADFIDALRGHLDRDASSSHFDLLVFPRYLAEKVRDAQSANEYQKKARAHFMVYGRVRERQIRKGEIAHILSLEGRVHHAPVPREVSQRISNEFTEVLPRRVVVPDEGSVFHFEATSEWLDLSTRYIVGLAALVSGDVVYAEHLLLSVEQRLPGVAPRLPALRDVGRRLPRHLSLLYRSWLKHLVEEYTRTRRKTFLQQAEPVVDKLLARDPTRYEALLAKAIIQFVLHHDIQGARRTIAGCKKTRDSAWRYSLAFLYAFEGRMDHARAEYDRAFRIASSDPTIALQCEEFIHIVLADYPDAAQLLFCCGLINLHGKGDPEAATRDFDGFLEHPASEQFPQLQQEARTLLASLAKSAATDGREPITAVDYKLRPLIP